MVDASQVDDLAVYCDTVCSLGDLPSGSEALLESVKAKYCYQCCSDHYC